MASPDKRLDKINKWAEFLKNPQANLPQLPSAQQSIDYLVEKNKAWSEKAKKRKAQRQVKAGQARLKRYQEKMRAPKKQEQKYPAHIQKEADEWLSNLVSAQGLKEDGDTWEVKSAKNRLAELQDELLKTRNFQQPGENDPQELLDQKQTKNKLIKQRIDAINADMKKQKEIITPPVKPDPKSKPKQKPGNREAELEALAIRLANGDPTAEAEMDSVLASIASDSSKVTNPKVTTPPKPPSKYAIKRKIDNFARKFGNKMTREERIEFKKNGTVPERFKDEWESFK